MVSVTLKNVVKRYGRTIAVDHVSLEIVEGTLFTFLGPSGCGKTTTLRLIAGFEEPDEGSIFFDNVDVTYRKPYERNTAMVFQNYALWPHMTVYENIAYGLKVRKVPRQEIRSRVKRVLELVKLEGLENRYPSQLSGGQQQRVALARALVVEPEVLLLDEPLSNLDAKLRIEMREEIKKIQRQLGITTIYVTHDQEEAMSISDKIAVMNQGRVLQIDTPENIYFRPHTLFVATFIGKTSVLEGEVISVEENKVKARVEGGLILNATLVDRNEARNVEKGTRVALVMRPEHFELEKGRGDWNEITGEVEIVMFVGTHKQVKLNVAPGISIMAYLPSDYHTNIGEKLNLTIPSEKTLAYPIPNHSPLKT